MTLTPFREGLQVKLLAGLWLLVFSTLFRGAEFPVTVAGPRRTLTGFPFQSRFIGTTKQLF